MGKGWGHTLKRHRLASTSTTATGGRPGTEGVGAEEASSSGAFSTLEQPVAGTGKAILRTIARALWRPSYTALFAEEYLLNEAACGGHEAIAPSGYRARLKGAAAERYDSRLHRRARDQLAIQLHGNNQQHWSPSLLARSVSYFNLTTNFVHAVESQQRRIASRPWSHAS